MTRTPSEHSILTVEDVTQDFYLLDCNAHVEQSAIYGEVTFSALGVASLGIVLTAQCDIEDAASTNYLLVARVVPMGMIFATWLERKGYSEGEMRGDVPIGPERAKCNSLFREFSETYLRNKALKYYLLPALDGKFATSVISFEITQCTQIQSIERLPKLCVLRSPFREAVPAHYSAYIGRVGTPRLSDDYLRAEFNSFCKMKDR